MPKWYGDSAWLRRLKIYEARGPDRQSYWKANIFCFGALRLCLKHKIIVSPDHLKWSILVLLKFLALIRSLVWTALKRIKNAKSPWPWRTHYLYRRYAFIGKLFNIQEIFHHLIDTKTFNMGIKWQLKIFLANKPSAKIS